MSYNLGAVVVCDSKAYVYLGYTLDEAVGRFLAEVYEGIEGLKPSFQSFPVENVASSFIIPPDPRPGEDMAV